MLPFSSKNATSLVLNGLPSLPIAIGGATQRKTPVGDFGVNSQDSFGIYIGEKMVVGVVCDGCGSGHKSTVSQDRFSSNEVGARLMVQAIINSSVRMLNGTGGLLATKPSLDKAFLQRLSKTLLKTLTTTVKAYCGTDEEMSERFILDNMMSTILGVIVMQDRFLVFGCGDGYVGVNDEIVSLKNQEGKYLANNLLPALCPKKYANGCFPSSLDSLATSTFDEFQGVLLATDGFAPVHSQDASFFQSLLKARPTHPQVESGHDRLLRELRGRLLTGPAKDVEFRDDATLLAVRRLNTTD
jgi:hypothetical protein